MTLHQYKTWLLIGSCNKYITGWLSGHLSSIPVFSCSNKVDLKLCHISVSSVCVDTVSKSVWSDFLLFILSEMSSLKLNCSIVKRSLAALFAWLPFQVNNSLWRTITKLSSYIYKLYIYTETENLNIMKNNVEREHINTLHLSCDFFTKSKLYTLVRAMSTCCTIY